MRTNSRESGYRVRQMTHPHSPNAVRKVLVVAAALASAMTVALLVAAPAGATPASPTSAAQVGAPIPWAACDPPDEGLQCARIRVPLDWDRPRGRTIRLAVIRHLASKPDQRIGTAFINPGGPGDTGVGLLKGDPEGVDAIGGGASTLSAGIRAAPMPVPGCAASAAPEARTAFGPAPRSP